MFFKKRLSYSTVTSYLYYTVVESKQHKSFKAIFKHPVLLQIKRIGQEAKRSFCKGRAWLNHQHCFNERRPVQEGVWFDSKPSMSAYISKLCNTPFYHLHNVCRIRKFLSPDKTETQLHSYITSGIDYCNSLLFGTPASQLNKTQCVLNAAARSVCRAPCYCHMCELHWLPLKTTRPFQDFAYCI